MDGNRSVLADLLTPHLSIFQITGKLISAGCCCETLNCGYEALCTIRVSGTGEGIARVVFLNIVAILILGDCDFTIGANNQAHGFVCLTGFVTKG